MNKFYQKADLEDIFLLAPKCKFDFSEFLTQNFEGLDFEKLSDFHFASCLGLFWAYFKDQGIDLDLNNLAPEETLDYLKNEISQYENTIAHFS